MKRILWISFASLLLFSMTAVFGQSEEEAVSTKQDEQTVETPAQQPQKVSEVRKVMRIATIQEMQNGKSEKEVVYDAKGGIVVPDKSEGFQQTRLTPEQQKKLAQIKGENTSAKTPQTKAEKDLSKSVKRKDQTNQSRKSEK